MSLRFKSLLIFAITVTLLFAIVLAFAKIVIERQFDQIEMEEMFRQARQFSAELREEITPMVSTAGDWARRDDLYDYASGRNPGFPARNLLPGKLSTLRLDFLAVFSQSGELVLLNTAPDQRRNKLSEDQILATIRQQKLIPQNDLDHPTAGMALAGDQLLFVTALPIARSDRSGAPAGTLVFGRAFAPETSDGFQDFASFRFEFLPLAQNPPATPADRQSITVEALDPQQMVAFVPLDDLRGHQITVARLTSDRPLHLQATRTISVFVISLASSAGILLFVVWYLLDSNVILPVRRLADRL
ncbi:MAG TPA: CHASE4 domain-containing protein, partial [Chthoniobacterales bacterium]|nr:CHASE4 domain-containing protein [Chthoniobacterales bacterium]